MNLVGLVFVGVGIFAVCGALFDWEWFMNNYKAKFLVKMITRTGARIFYGLLGSAITVLGVLVLLGIVEQ